MWQPRLFMSISIVLFSLISSSAIADLTPGQKLAAETLIKDFAAKEFAARQQAVDKLIAIGPDVIPIVRKTLAETTDNEVKLRCQMVLKALGDKATAPVDKTARDASRVTFDFKDAPLAEVVEKLAELSGNRPFHVDEKLKGKTVTLAVKDTMYWEAANKVAGSLNLICARYWGTPGREAGQDALLQLVEADKDAKLTGYAGPAVVKADSVAKIELLLTAKQPLRGLPDQGGLNVGLTYFWEDRLDPLTEEIELTKVQTPKGDSLLPQTPDARRMANPAMLFTPGVKTAPVASGQFRLPMPAPDVRFISELSGVVRLEFATSEREVPIDDIFAKTGQSIQIDDWTITIKKVDNQKGALFVYVEAKYKGEPFDIPRFWTSGSYGWYVQTAGGAQRARGFSYHGGAWGPGGRGKNPQAAPQPPQKGESTFMFLGEYQAGAAGVVLVLPKSHETKEYPFTIKDVPLP